MDGGVKPNRTVTELSTIDVFNEFSDPRRTGLQRDELWVVKYHRKSVQWFGHIFSVEGVAPSNDGDSYIAIVIHAELSDASRQFSLSLHVPYSERQRYLQLFKGDRVKIQTTLNYGTPPKMVSGQLMMFLDNGVITKAS
jgi:hypothetical protein